MVDAWSCLLSFVAIVASSDAWIDGNPGNCQILSVVDDSGYGFQRTGLPY